MNKKVTLGKDAKQKLLDGVEILANAVTATLGPSGRNVLIEKQNEYPSSTKDGVTVAKSIKLEDSLENLGAQIVKQASIKTADQAGDGTTTSTLLAYELFRSGLKSLDINDNVVEFKKGMDDAVTDAVKYLRTQYSKEITEESQLKQVATISGNNDATIGELISTAIDKVGTDGVVTIEESKTGETYLETVEGMQFNRGYKSPYFVTDNNSMTTVLNNPLILITDKRLNAVKELLPILEGVSQQNKSLLVIAEDIDGEALSTMVVNKARGILSCVAVKAPEFGDKRKAILEDIATLTGGKVVSSEKGMRLDKFQSEWLGRANKVTVGKDTTTIIDASGEQEAIEARVEEIKNQIDQSSSPYEKETLQNRLSKFLGGVAVVHVGGHTEVEMKEKKDRVEDALHATKAALEEGILPGGGVALLNAARHLDDNIEEMTIDESDEYQKGYYLVVKVCSTPIMKILQNAGFNKAGINEVISDIQNSEDNWYGYNPKEDDYFNMFKEGIIDPTKVTRLALENAASVAGTLLLTEATITDIKDEKENNSGIDPNMLLG